MNWHIGQRIVAVVNHEQGYFIKGQEFIVKGIRVSKCKCKKITLDIGLPPKERHGYTKCVSCGSRSAFVGCWFSETRFHPLDFLSDYTADELIEEIETPVLVLNGSK